MYLAMATVKIQKVREKSMSVLVSYHTNPQTGKKPQYLGSASIRSFKTMENSPKIIPKENTILRADILLHKDDQYRTWIVFIKFHEIIQAP